MSQHYGRFPAVGGPSVADNDRSDNMLPHAILHPVARYTIDSLRSQAKADMSKSLASLKLLLDHPVGIGDHSTDDYHKNVAQALDQLVDAEDRIAILDKWFPERTMN